MHTIFDHSKNLHTLVGAQSALPIMLSGKKPASLLDVGCGTGTWIKAALALGIEDVLGVDGITYSAEKVLVPPPVFRQQDLSVEWKIGRRFDVALCLEVAEHLDEVHSVSLIRSLANHADIIFFSAACPGQLGQNHLNCQWPEYWQALFNAEGFVCDDEPRWKLWDVDSVEPWYRQNMFKAIRSVEKAGKENRIRPVIHPDMLQWLSNDRILDRYADQFLERSRIQIEAGSESSSWYLKTPAKALWRKFSRKAFSFWFS